MTTRGRSGIGGITTGGIIVIIGIIVAIVWNLWLGIIIALIGLIAFGGFARGKWYGRVPPRSPRSRSRGRRRIAPGRGSRPHRA